MGAQGKVDEAKEAVRQAEKFKQERTALERLLTQSSTPANHIEDLANQLSKPMEVCQVKLSPYFFFFLVLLVVTNVNAS